MKGSKGGLHLTVRNKNGETKEEYRSRRIPGIGVIREKKKKGGRQWKKVRSKSGKK